MSTPLTTPNAMSLQQRPKPVPQSPLQSQPVQGSGRRCNPHHTSSRSNGQLGGSELPKPPPTTPITTTGEDSWSSVIKKANRRLNNAPLLEFAAHANASPPTIVSAAQGLGDRSTAPTGSNVPPRNAKELVGEGDGLVPLNDDQKPGEGVGAALSKAVVATKTGESCSHPSKSALNVWTSEAIAPTPLARVSASNDPITTRAQTASPSTTSPPSPTPPLQQHTCENISPPLGENAAGPGEIDEIPQFDNDPPNSCGDSNAITNTSVQNVGKQHYGRVSRESLNASLFGGTAIERYQIVEERGLSKTNLYIKGLSPQTTDQDLVDLCRKFGNITSTKAILDKETNTCKGYGFVDFDNAEAAQMAIKELRVLGTQVQMAKQQSIDSTNLYIANLPLSINDRDLEKLMASFGAVVSTRILRDPENGNRSRGVGFARMESRSVCERVINELHGKVLPGSTQGPILCKFADGIGQASFNNRRPRIAPHQTSSSPYYHGNSSITGPLAQPNAYNQLAGRFNFFGLGSVNASILYQQLATLQQHQQLQQLQQQHYQQQRARQQPQQIALGRCQEEQQNQRKEAYGAPRYQINNGAGGGVNQQQPPAEIYQQPSAGQTFTQPFAPPAHSSYLLYNQSPQVAPSTYLYQNQQQVQRYQPNTRPDPATPPQAPAPFPPPLYYYTYPSPSALAPHSLLPPTLVKTNQINSPSQPQCNNQGAPYGWYYCCYPPQPPSLSPMVPPFVPPPPHQFTPDFMSQVGSAAGVRLYYPTSPEQVPLTAITQYQQQCGGEELSSHSEDLAPDLECDNDHDIQDTTLREEPVHYSMRQNVDKEESGAEQSSQPETDGGLDHNELKGEVEPAKPTFASILSPPG